MEATDRKLFVQIIGQLLIADGALTDAEREHLDEVMDEVGLPADERRAAMAGISLDSPIGERVRELSAMHRPSLVAAAERAIHADGEASRSELHMVELIREAAGG